ncbi:MAG TPA: M48 family peptidase [Lachnoclostridium phytofermentans]|uniref:M48 family peptidase n=1 Tax=Lachnoclostridium phytofermentans TaxID=66219 RepID=A0A3D2XBM0_9FIRM|nr:SprT family zinc-dependent metalloprotease [Lachnoclostridium sp.]HCL03738.1 M48 family peptidase [Lachnoclostridium phytofermentans]
MEIILNDKSISFQIQYTKASKFNLDFSPEGLITLKAPKKSTLEEVNAFMKSNSKAILKFEERMSNRTYLSSVKTYESDENFLFLGKVHKLSDLLSELPATPATDDEAQEALKKFYTAKTKEIITERLAIYEPIIQVKAKSFTIVDSPATWGTCNSKKQLTFNYKLSMARQSAIDYVVIHELCHIMHLNHDRSFWRKVGMYDKDYKMHQDYLARFGAFMTI